MKLIQVKKDILAAQEVLAKENRELFKTQGVFVLNLMGSPGAGKTTLLERTIELFKDCYTIGVIEGDVATSYDAERIGAHGIEVVQINTRGACHLDAAMIKRALTEFSCDRLDVLIIENVGNLVCPAEFDLGEDRKVMVLSVTEGEDKPFKYPLMFRLSHALVISKVDLLPYCECDTSRIYRDARALNGSLEMFEISGTKKTGLGRWKEWLQEEIKKKKQTR